MDLPPSCINFRTVKKSESHRRFWKASKHQDEPPGKTMMAQGLPTKHKVFGFGQILERSSFLVSGSNGFVDENYSMVQIVSDRSMLPSYRAFPLQGLPSQKDSV